MNVKTTALILMLSISHVSSDQEALASSGNPIIYIAWDPTTEILEYHSCGAADACWVAQVKNKKTKQRIAVLRCDGEKPFSRIGKSPEAIAAEDCHRFENEDKFQQIPAELRTLLHR
jgi:hypothetical protein